jgi:hypothetical protein
MAMAVGDATSATFVSPTLTASRSGVASAVVGVAVVAAAVVVDSGEGEPAFVGGAVVVATVVVVATTVGIVVERSTEPFDPPHAGAANSAATTSTAVRLNEPP